MKIPTKQFKSKDKKTIARSSRLMKINERQKRNRTEESLPENEQRFRAIFEEGPLGMALIGPDFHFTKVNAMFCKILGYSKHELLRMKFSDIAYPDHIAEDVQSAKKIMMGKIATYRTERRYIRKDGQIVWGAITATAIRNRKKQFQYIFAMFEDITERQQAEVALYEETIMRRILFENSPDGVLVINPETAEFIEFNTAAHTQLGYSREEFARLKITDVEVKETQEETKETLSRVLREGRADFETLQRTKQGEVRNVLVTAQVIDVPGRSAYYCIWRDITDRKKAEEAIRQSEEKYKTLFMSMSEGFYLSEILYDDNGEPCDYRYLDVNPKFEQILGLSRDQIIGRRYKDLVPVDTTQWLDTYFKVARTGKPLTYQFYSNEYGKYFETFSYKPDKDRVSVFVLDITERKHAEEQLIIKDFALESSVSAIGLADLDGNLIYVNKAYLQLWGFSDVKEVIGKHISEFSLSKDTVAEAINILQSGNSYVGEAKYARKDGTFLEVQVTANLVTSPDGMPVCTMASFVDITERKEMEEQIRISEEHYRTLIDTSPDAIIIVSGLGNILYASKKANVVFGYPGDESFVGNSVLEWIRPEDYGSVMSRLNDILSGQSKPESREYPLRKSDGTPFWGEINSSQLINRRGEVTGLLLVCRDISERKAAAEALRQSESRLQRAQMIAHVGNWELDLKTKRMWGSEEAFRMYGFERTTPELPLELIQNIVMKADRPALDQAMQQLIAQKGEYREEFRIRRANDGEIRCISSIAELVVASDGLPEKVVGVLQDITERKQVEEELRKSEERLRKAQKIARVGNWEINLKNKTMWYSDEAIDIYGADKMSLEYTLASVQKHVVPDDRPALDQALKNLIDQNGEYKVEYQIKRQKDGEIRNIYSIGELLLGPDGTPESVVGVIQDITERKQAEKELHESEIRYRFLFEQNPAPMLIYEMGTLQILAVNEAFIHQYGFSRQEALSMLLPDLYPEEEKVPIAELTTQLQGHARAGVWHHHKRDGSLITIEAFSHDLVYQGHTARVAVVLDVTDRERAVLELRHSEMKYREMVEQINDILFSVDTHGVFSYISPAIEFMSGYKPDEMIGRLVEEFLDPLFISKYKVQIQNSMSGKLEPSEYRMKIKSGEFRWVRFSSKPIYDGEKLVGVRGVLTDVTERKKAEETLSLLNHTVKSVGECVSVTDLHNNILYVNQAFLDTYGYTEEEVLGINISNMVYIKDSDKQEVLTATLNGEWHGERMNRKKNGMEFPIHLSTSTVRDELGNPIALVGVATDITEQKKLQQELLQSQKMQSVGTLAGGIAHDFNNILGIILGYASILERQKNDEQKFIDSIAAINQAVHRGASLVRQILTFARKTDVEFEVINVNDLANELLSMLQQTFPKIITFKIIIEKNIPSIQADRTQIHQALLNLCVNARDAMPDGGSLTIKTETMSKKQIQEKFPTADQNAYVCISVTDTGEGMDEATRRRIFDPFFTTKEKGKGTGLGLSVTYGVLQTHNGFINVESELGCGSTFRLYFPVSPEYEKNIDSQKAGGSFEAGGTETILIIEDEELILEMVHFLLEAKGYHVYIAHDGVEAVNIYKEHGQKIDLVLSDMGLPGMTGSEVVKKLREMNPEVKVVLASGYFDPDSKREIFEAGVKEFIQKPYSPDEVLRKLREVLDKKQE
jgi:PAS domain S-box-containing protein